MSEIMTSLLSRTEAAQYLGISTRTLDRRSKSGCIPYISSCPGGRIHYRREALEKYIRQNTHNR